MLYTLKSACFSSKQTDFSSIQDNLAQNPKFLPDNRHGSNQSRVLICNMNTPLACAIIVTALAGIVALFGVFSAMTMLYRRKRSRAVKLQRTNQRQQTEELSDGLYLIDYFYHKGPLNFSKVRCIMNFYDTHKYNTCITIKGIRI